jgi:sortase A
VAYQLWGSGFAEAKSKTKLKNQFTTAPAPAADNPALGPAQTAVTGAPEGTAIAHLVIPAIAVDKYVVEGVTEAALKEGPGHYPGTPRPGEPGNVAIAGHRTTYGAPFFRLNELKPGDKIQIAVSPTKQFLYVVDHTEIVKPTDVAVIANTPDNRLTLTTCNPRYEATTRLIVVAKLTDEPVVPPSTVAPPVVKTAVSLGTGDHSAWPPTLLYGLFFVVLWVGIRLWSARRRYWKWIPFVAGIPLCLFPLWFFFENAFRLLPNNI